MCVAWVCTASRSCSSCSDASTKAYDTFTFSMFSACKVHVLWHGASPPIDRSPRTSFCVTCASTLHGSTSGSHAISAWL